MKKTTGLLLIGLLLLPAIWLTAQENKQDKVFFIDAQIRARGEYRNGALFPREEGESSAAFINNRTRLTLGYKQHHKHANLELRIAGQHVGVWGQSGQIKNQGDFMLNEAWAKLSFDNGFFAQLGRQVLSYDDERILGGLDWNVSGRYHDLLKLGYANDLHTAHLVFAFNQDNEFAGKRGNYYSQIAGYKSMQMAWYHFGNKQQPFGISLLAMNLGWEMGEPERPSNGFMQTLGTHLSYINNYWDLNGSFYYQTGKSKSNQSVSAFMASIQAKAKLTSDWAVSVGSDYLSGGKSTDTKYKAFDPLYGTHHKFYGAMDYFYASSFIHSGLWDNQAGVYFKPSPKVDLSLNYHYFRTAKQFDTDFGPASKSLGSEIDFQINWSIMPDVKLMAGYSFMLGTNSMDMLKGGNHKSWQDWGWISLNITPRLFITSTK